jgi:signal transduction histidine kinase
VSKRDAKLSTARAASATCRQHWQADASHAALLPPLVARLAALERIEANFQAALEAEKLASLKELAYGAGHEINNPLANISLRAQTLLKEEPDPERRRRLAGIVSQVGRAHEMIADMMLFARPPQLERESFELAPVAQAVIDSLSAAAASLKATITLLAPTEPIALSADKAQIAVVLQTLLTNALEAIDPQGTVELTLFSHPDIYPASVELIVADNGRGISPEVRRHLFDPFYSGREAGRGLGFGLSKCWRIVTDHGGQIVVDSQAGRGATFTVTLPLAAPAPAATINRD